jgi:branched-chain amino acid transport system substrate-binding protein
MNIYLIMEGRKMKKFMALFLAVAFLASFMVLGSVEKARAAKTIKIGVLLDFTGPISSVGPPFQRGIEYAFEEIDYTIAGKKIKLIIADSSSDPTIAMEKTKKLVEHDKVHVIIGPLMGDQQMSIAPYVKGKGVIVTTLYAGVGDIVEHGMFLVYPTTCVGLTLPAGWYAHDQGHRKMITLGADYAGGHLFMKGAKEGFEAKGGSVIQELWPPVGTADYGPTISTLNREADVIVAFLAGPTEFQRFLPQYKSFGIKIPVIGTTVGTDLPSPVITEMGDAVKGMQGQAIYIATRDDPTNNTFQAGFKKRFDKEADALEALSYCISKAVQAGLEATGGDDSFDKLWPAILASDIVTPQGRLSWTPHGVAVTDVYIAEAKEKAGKLSWEPVKIYKQVQDPRFPK